MFFLQGDVSNLLRSYTADRDRLRAAIEAFEYQAKTSTLTGGGSNVALAASLRYYYS